MPRKRPPTRPQGPRQLLAEAACASFGVALLIWGLTPAVVERLVTRQPPSWQAFALGASAFVTGFAFIGLFRLMRRGVLWATWTAMLVSLVLAGGGILLSWSSPHFRPSLFLMVFSTGTVITTASALLESRKETAPRSNGRRALGR